MFMPVGYIENAGELDLAVILMQNILNVNLTSFNIVNLVYTFKPP